MKKNKIKTKI